MNTAVKIRPAKIRQALDLLVQSQEFARSDRSVELIKHLVEKSLAGEADDLKAYAIGIDVFGMEASADSDQLASVRVEMGRLRKKIERFYLMEGRSCATRIELPLGTYQPVFAATEQTIEPESGRVKITSIKKRSFVIFSLVGLFLIAGLVGWKYFLNGGNRAQMPRAPVIAVLPFDNFSANKKLEYLASGLAYDIVSELSRFSWLAVAVISPRDNKAIRKVVSTRSLKIKPSSSFPNNAQPDYILDGSINFTSDRVLVSYRLNDANTGTVKWSKTFDRNLSIASIFEIQKQTATAIAVEVGHPDGLVKRLESIRYRRKPQKLSAYFCTLQAYKYWHSFSAYDHLQSRFCLEQTANDDPYYSEALAALSFLYLDEARYGTNKREGYDPVKRAGQTARYAIEFNQFSTLAHQALFTVQLYGGNEAGFYRTGNTALKFTPNNPELLADFGTKMALHLGKWRDGLKYVESALRMNTDPAAWYYLAPAYRAIMVGDYEKAIGLSDKMNSQNWAPYHLIRFISFAALEDVDLANREKTMLATLGFGNQRSGNISLDNWRFDKSLRLTLRLKLTGAFLFASKQN